MVGVPTSMMRSKAATLAVFLSTGCCAWRVSFTFQWHAVSRQQAVPNTKHLTVLFIISSTFFGVYLFPFDVTSGGKVAGGK
jgi:NADH:ubiquinone oxidoreductase subunit 6 (subunit J)